MDHSKTDPTSILAEARLKQEIFGATDTDVAIQNAKNSLRKKDEAIRLLEERVEFRGKIARQVIAQREEKRRSEDAMAEIINEFARQLGISSEEVKRKYDEKIARIEKEEGVKK